MRKPTRKTLSCAVGVLLLLGALVAVLATTEKQQERGESSSARSVHVTRPAAALTTPSRRPGAERSIARPLAVSVASASHEWTAGDASELRVIEQIAHNPEEALRMVEENDRIHRRQLVYRKQTAGLLVQQSMVTGEPLTQLILPGLDGHELAFVIERADLAPSGQTGSFTGHLAGSPGSQVSLAFKGGREAFTVISPDDDLYLQADPREPGEVIVKAIDPQTYVQGTCGNSDHDH